MIVNVTESVPGGAVPLTLNGLKEVEVTSADDWNSPRAIGRKSASRKLTFSVAEAAPPSDATYTLPKNGAPGAAATFCVTFTLPVAVMWSDVPESAISLLGSALPPMTTHPAGVFPFHCSKPGFWSVSLAVASGARAIITATVASTETAPAIIGKPTR